LCGAARRLQPQARKEPFDHRRTTLAITIFVSFSETRTLLDMRT